MNPKSRLVLISAGVGLVFGFLCLAQAAEKITLMPESLFLAVHQPALFVSGLFFQGERALLGMPVAIPLQWLVAGWIVGVVLGTLKGNAKTPR